MTARRAFTLVEMTIVIGIIILLAGLTLAVSVSVVLGSEVRQTELTIRLMDAALQEWEAQADRQVSYGVGNEPLGQEEQYEVGQLLSPQDAAIELLDIIRRNSAVLKILASVDPDFVTHPNPDDPSDDRLILLDAWGTQIVVVFPGRLWVLSADKGDFMDLDGTIRTETEKICGVAVDRQICFVSAGPDGDFGSFDTASPEYDPEAARDNLFSYAPQIYE